MKKKTFCFTLLLLCCVKLFGCSESTDLNLSLIDAVKNHDIKKISDLLDKGADPNFRQPGVGSAMSNSTLCPTTDCMELLILNGGDPNIYLPTTNRSLIFKTISPGMLDYVALLVTNGANVNSLDGVGSTPLITAIILEQLDIAKFLIENGADVSIKNNFGYDAKYYFENSLVERQMTTGSLELFVYEAL